MTDELKAAQEAFLSDMNDNVGAMSEEDIEAVLATLELPDKIALMVFITDYYTNVLEPSLQGVVTNQTNGTKH